jgi:hypothetical protein
MPARRLSRGVRAQRVRRAVPAFTRPAVNRFSPDDVSIEGRSISITAGMPVSGVHPNLLASLYAELRAENGVDLLQSLQGKVDGF